MKDNLLKRLMFLLVCFGLTTWMSAQTVYQVAAGDNAIGDALIEASADDIIELTTSGGVYTDSAALNITYDITIRAAAGLAEKPIIDGGTNDPIIEVSTGGLTVEGVKFINGAYVIHVSAADPVTSSDFSLKVNNCEFHNWTQRAIYTSDGTLTPLDSVLVSNTIFKDGVKQAFYLKQTRNGSNIFPGGYRYCKIYNCLITGLTSTGDGHGTYIEPGNRDIGDQGWPTVIIDHVTVDNCMAGISTYTTPGALVQNCVVTNLTNPTKNCYDIQSGRWSTDPLPPVSNLKNSIYSGGELSLQGSSTVVGVTENVDSVTAIYTDAAHGNYALAEGSAGKGTGTDGLDMGYLGPYLINTLPVIASPGFEEDTSFNAWSSDWENASINENLDYVKSGSKSLKVGPVQGGRAQWVSGFTVGTTISLLAWGISDGELNNPAWIGFVAYDESETKLFDAEGTSVDSMSMINPDGWSRLCATMTIPDETFYLHVYLWYSGDDNAPTTSVSVYVDDYEFVWGDSCAVSTDIKTIKYNSLVNVYPNPTEGPVYINFGRDITGVSSIEIFDVTGKVVSRLNSLNNHENVQLDMSSFAAGVYFGMIKTQGGRTHSFKIIKK